MPDALRARAAQGGQRMAFAFARQQSAARPELEELTFAGLLARSEAVGAALDGCCGAGDRVLILAPPGLDYIVAVYGCLIAGRVAVPAYPPRNARNIDRLATMTGDCGAALVLTTADLIERVAQWSGGRLPEMVALDRLPADGAAGWRAPRVRARGPGDPAIHFGDYRLAQGCDGQSCQRDRDPERRGTAL